MSTIDKKEVIRVLGLLAEAIQNSPNVSNINFNFNHETLDYPFGEHGEQIPSGWIILNLNIRFFKPCKSGDYTEPKKVEALSLEE